MDQRTEKVQGFIEKAEMEFEKSRLEIPMYYEGKFLETLIMDAYLKIDRGAPFTNLGGYRQFNFQIIQWDVHGYSEKLDKHFFFMLSDVPQPKSVCLSNQKESDYPAAIVYNALYDIYVDGELIAKAQSGLGIGTDVYETPPRTDTHFQKAFQYGPIATAEAACVAMQSISEEVFNQKTAEIRERLKRLQDNK